MPRLKSRLYTILRWSERYLKTDMIYLASGGVWLVLGQLGAIVLSLALAVAFGHLASQDLYGNYKYVLSLMGILAAFSLTGISTAIIQATARGYEGSLQQGSRLSLKWSYGLVAGSILLSIYYFFFKQNDFLGFALLIVALFVPFSNSFSLFTSFLIGKKEFSVNSLYSFANLLVPSMALIATLVFSHRAIVAVAVYLTATMLSNAFFYTLTLRRATNSATDPASFKYGAHLSVMGFINTVADKIDSIIIFTFLGPAQLAIYTFALAAPEQIKQFGNLLAKIALPRFSERSISEIRSTLWHRIGYLVLATFLVLLIYVICAPLIFRFLFPQYLEAVFYSRIYAFSIVFAVITAPIAAIFQAHKKTTSLYRITNGSAAFLIIIVPIFVYLYGLLGAILSQILFRIVTTSIAIYEIRKADAHTLS